MRCRVLKCHENEDGCCMCSSYVEIDESGQCDHMWVRTENADDAEDKEDAEQ